MGYNTSVVVMNDSLDAIAKDEFFGKKLADAITLVACRSADRIYNNDRNVSALGHCNAVTVIESHHADYTHLIAVGGNYGTDLGFVGGYTHHTEDAKVRLLQQLADNMGYRIVKKSKPRGR